MGKIKQLREDILLGNNSQDKIYPITYAKAVYDENNKRLDNIIKDIYGSTPTVEDSSTESDFQISDTEGNVIAEFQGGHFRTKEFDSRNIIGAEVIKDSQGRNILTFK